MNLSSPFIDGLTAQQDFFWLLAILVWVGLLVCAWQARTDAGAKVPGWLIGVALGELSLSIVSLALTIFPRAVIRGVPQLGYDLVLWLPLTVTMGAFCWGAWSGAARWAACAGIAGLTITRYYRFPDLSTELTAALVCVAGLRIARVPRTFSLHSRLWRFGIFALTVLPLVSPAGPVAFWIHDSQMWNRLPRLALPSAVGTAATGAIWLGLFLTLQSTHETTIERRLRADELRRFAIGLCCWLAIGFGLTTLSGQMARRAYEQSLLAQARMGASQLDRAQVADCLAPALQLGPLIDAFLPDGRQGMPYAKTSYLGRERVAGLQSVLSAVRDATGALYAHLETLRGGYRASFLFSEGVHRDYGFVSLQHSTNREDLAAWATRAETVELNSEWGPHVRVRVPIVATDGRMLGWMALEISVNAWLAVQAQARLQALLLTGTGVALGVLGFILRARAREKSSAVEATMAAQQAERMKTVFLAKVSHELRTPIQSVLGYSDLLRSSITEPVARGRLKALRQHGELMLRLVNDLLDLSAIQAGAFRLVEKPTALAELVAQTIESLRPRAEAKGLEFFFTEDPAVPAWAIVDGGRVRQIILNLVGNALKFTDRGRVDVTLHAGPGENEVTLVVRDTGPGIPAADLGRLFRSFERLEATAAKEGTGLGLALSAALCRGMNGHIAAESAAGGGATFRASFRAVPCETPVAVGRSSAGLPPLAGRQILLADDNALVRELFMATLKEAGAICVAVADGEAALAAAAQENFDAAVLDLSMPKLDGIETARALRKIHGPTLRIVGLTAHAGQREHDDAVAVGMDAFLVKPVELDALVAALMPAPSSQLPVETARSELLERLRVQFRISASAEAAAITGAITAGDFELVRRHAHHLLNSAAVVRDDWLFSACASVERAALGGDAVAVAAAWQNCETALEPWIRSPATPARAATVTNAG